MNHSTQKRKLTEYLDGLYKILREDNYITTSSYTFSKSWETCKYEDRLAGLGIDLLYAVVMQNDKRLMGIRDRIRVDFAGDIEGFLNADGYIKSKVNKPKKGLSLLCWVMLEKLKANDMDYFKNLYQALTTPSN